ncbi:MAG: hypothetical protein WCK27_01500, partial [Verrucomicrobiota bacterium]
MAVKQQTSGATGGGASQDSSRGDFTRQIRAFRISLPGYNAACLSLTPHLSGVGAVVSGAEPLQRFTRNLLSPRRWHTSPAPALPRQQFSLCDGDGSPNPKPEIRNPKEIRDPK